ncbi:MAG TPA: hypothetical protein VF665_05175, partial [Longimicrobium sp.]|uniref:hypothetical protein n=1 Tax=Longimicrobium sp. TaxID=2029185 RepID=UPI002ED848B5
MNSPLEKHKVRPRGLRRPHRREQHAPGRPAGSVEASIVGATAATSRGLRLFERRIHPLRTL